MSTESYTQPNLENLNCRVRLIEEMQDGFTCEAFGVEICGTIYAPPLCEGAVAEISVTDTTEGTAKIKPVYTFIDKGQIDYSHVFCHSVNLGRLPNQVTKLPHWMAIARIPADCLALPHTGTRNLQFTVSILSRQGSNELAFASGDFTYENLELGYIELEKNIRRAKIMSVAIAFVVAATEKTISANAVALVRNWVRKNIASYDINKINGSFYALLARMITLLSPCSRFFCRTLCRKITAAAPMKVRCDILELCLRVAGTGGIIAFEQLILMKHIANWFEIHREKFRSMVEAVLPLRMHEVEDMEISLGIASDMDNDEICHQLSKEYRKWNARVISHNTEIENQAEHMLKLIAELRDECAD